MTYGPSGYGVPSSIGTSDPQSLGWDIKAATTTGTWAAGTGGANTSWFVPIRFVVPTLVKRLWYVIGGTSSGNVDMGIYDTSGNKLISAGSTAQGTANTTQYFDIDDQQLFDLWYIGFAINNAAGTFYQITLTLGESVGIKQLTFPLPSPATFITNTIGKIPLVGIDTLGVA